jgi:hypothetical protein
MYTMFRYSRFLLWLGILACSIVPRQAHSSEMRAFWCDAWGKGFKTPAQAEQLVDFAAKYGFNAVFVEVRKRGDACWGRSQKSGASVPISDCGLRNADCPEHQPFRIADLRVRIARSIDHQPCFVIFDYAALSQVGDDGKCLADRIRIVR